MQHEQSITVRDRTRPSWQQWAYIAARLLLAGVFIYAGATKIASPEAFAKIISGYGLAPDWALMPLAVTLPLLEILAGLGLILDIRGSLAIITGLTLLFMAVLWHGLSMGLDIDCGCYAPGDPEAEAYHGLRQALVRDAVLLALCLWCYWHRHRARLLPRTVRSVLKRFTSKGEDA